MSSPSLPATTSFGRVLAAGLLLFALAAPTPAGVTQTMPLRGGTSPASGLQLNLATEGADGYGYRPVHFRFKLPAAATSDQLLTVRFHAGSPPSRRRDLQASISVERDGEMPTGATSADLVLSAPNFGDWRLVWWDVWVDGVRDPHLSLDKKQAIAHPQASQGTTLSRATLRDIVSLAPQSWKDLPAYDVVECRVSELSNLRAERPAVFGALLQWIELGGRLWVTLDRGDRHATLDELLKTNRRLSFPAALEKDGETETDAPSGPTEGWVWSAITDERDSAQAIERRSTPDAQRLENQRQAAGRQVGIAERRYGFGLVVTRPARARWNAESLDAYSLQHAWTRRHGLEPNAANDDFSNLLVPGVGVAPVNEFRILITLFVVVVGPVNFWLLKRQHRAHLMTITVPAAALTLTSLLLLYALLSDGFGTLVRARSVTLLDQQRGEHATWGRLSYYAGLAPADGLRLPTDCVMYPILPGSNELTFARIERPTREIEWTEEEQCLSSGWLPSRSPTQYLQVRAGEIDRRLDIQASPDTLSTKNQLGVDIEWLLIVDEAGRMWLGSGVRDGGQADLEQADRNKAVQQALKIVTDAEPVFPAGLGPDASSPILAQERRALRKRLRNEIRNYSSAGASDSLLNGLLDDLAGLSGGGALRLAPRSYVAVARQAVGVAVGIDGADERGSCHVVIGRW